MSCGAEEPPLVNRYVPFLSLDFELPDERREPRGKGGREGVVLVLEALPNRGEHNASVPRGFVLVLVLTGMAAVEQMTTNPIVDAVCCLSCGGDCRHGDPPSNAGPPRSKANDRLTLELNYQGEDVKSDQQRASWRQGLATYPRPGPRQVINAETCVRFPTLRRK
jgi:hypothetical protein